MVITRYNSHCKRSEAISALVRAFKAPLPPTAEANSSILKKKYVKPGGNLLKILKSPGLYHV